MIRIGPAIALVIIGLHAVGCSTLGSQLNGLNESTIKITSAVIPDWDKRCLDAATKCADDCKRLNAAASQPTEKVSADSCKEACGTYQTCKQDRAIFYTAINAIHTSIAYACTFMQTGEEPKAQAILTKVVAALADVYRLAQEAGFTLK